MASGRSSAAPGGENGGRMPGGSCAAEAPARKAASASLYDEVEATVRDPSEGVRADTNLRNGRHSSVIGATSTEQSKVQAEVEAVLERFEHRHSDKGTETTTPESEISAR